LQIYAINVNMNLFRQIHQFYCINIFYQFFWIDKITNYHNLHIQNRYTDVQIMIDLTILTS